MPISKPDFNLIFASQAPSQDLPAAFNNYARGWDESRKNNGKPTIKQFNYLIQQLDLKALWMIQNGAALPFDEAIDYADGSIVLKDGLIQQKNGASWIIPFMRGSQNLADLTNVATARTNLDVYSKSEVYSKDETLSKDNNLSELTDNVVARTNLDVYSKAETDARPPVVPQSFIDTVFGIDQSRKTITIVSGTTYTNTSLKPKVVSVTFQSTSTTSRMVATLSVGLNTINDMGIATNSTDARNTITETIMPGESYVFTAIANCTIQSAREIS